MLMPKDLPLLLLLLASVTVLLLPLAECALTPATGAIGHPIAPKEAIEKMRMGKDSFEAVRDLHNVWYMHSIKALLVQLGKQILPRLKKDDERSFLLCLHRIPSKTDITRASQCLMAAKESLERPVERVPATQEKTPEQTATFAQDKLPFAQSQAFVQAPVTANVQVIQMPESFRPSPLRAIEIRRRPSVFTPSPHLLLLSSRSTDRRTLPIRKTPKYTEKLPKRARKGYLNRHVRFWSSGIQENSQEDEHRRLKRHEHRLVDREGARVESGYKISHLERMPELKQQLPSPVQHITNACFRTATKQHKLQSILNIVRGERQNQTAPRWTDTYKNILNIKKSLDDSAKGPGARVYDLPMEALVLDKNSSSSSSSVSAGGLSRQFKMPEIVQQAFNLADAFRGHTSKGGKEANAKMLSPRFAPLLPDKYESRGLFSPSILSFYKDDAEDQLVPIPTLLEATGMSPADRDSMLEMIMEVSGARTTVDKAFETLKKLNLFGLEGELVEVTKALQKTFNDVERSFSRRQKAQMKRRGFSFLDKHQLMNVYDKHGVQPEAYADLDLDDYSKQTPRQKEAALWKRIHLIAANGTVPSEEQHTRGKRQITTISVLKPTVLAPYMFTPIFGLSVLGPVVLSPSLFSPLILNPAVLSPYVLSPAVGMPFILSPYLLSPYVLSPLVMAPFILNPYVLSPNVINPYVLSPLILSPLVLCPDVLSPMVLGGAILSPSVGSPSVFSKSTLMATVLSPTFLS